MAFTDTLRLVIAPPHRAGYPSIGVGVVACVVGLLVAAWLAWIGLLFSAFCLYFFRDPERVAPLREGLVLAPADGRVVWVGPGAPPPELGWMTARG